MKILTGAIGSIPRPTYLVEGMQAFTKQSIDIADLNEIFNKVLKETIKNLKKPDRP